MRVLAVLVAVCLLPTSSAFVVIGSERSPSVDAYEDLRTAVRWSSWAGTWQDDGIHGLEGGIEYVIHDDFCDEMIPAIVDAESCAPILESIQDAFDIWGDAHPFLDFNRVDSPRTDIDPELSIRPNQNMTSRTFAWAAAGSYTEPGVVATSGIEMDVHASALGFIEFNSGRGVCFNLVERVGGDDCGHFPTIFAHEVGHVIGLGHPDANQGRYFDSNDDPLDDIPINCTDPMDGLKVTHKKTGRNVMNSIGGSPKDLSVDDIGGLYFLYPVCPDQEQPPWATAAGFTEIPMVPMPVVLAAVVALVMMRRTRPGEP